MITRIREVTGFWRIFREVEFTSSLQWKGKEEVDTRPGNFIMSVIILNCVVLFLHSFSRYHSSFLLMEWIDHICTIIFTVELIINLYERGFRYLRNPWHLFDAFIVLVSLVTFLIFIMQQNQLIPDMEYLLVARILRVFKFYRLFEGSVNIREMFVALGKGMKASFYVVMAFLVYNFVVSLISYYIFHNIAPQHFENGFLSFYSTFKAFTGEVFEMAESIKTDNMATMLLIRFYFISVVISGGIIGLSLINTIFINEVTKEERDENHKELKELKNEIQELKNMLQTHFDEKKK
ncbi:MAG: ion transporter [Cytophagaceae bacterium]|jgi:voltage-gated sodium channel|nr:ion transporter [Cytophagaceae bacterium]